jgi:hypothetical protein
MIDNSEKLEEAIALLHHPRSKKRESGAKRLRKFADPRAGAALLAALEKEVLDSRTWSAQCHMILALGFCEYRPALPFLWKLARRETEHTTLYSALGDAIVRIGPESDHDMAPVFEAIGTRRFQLIDGALRAMAMLRMVPTDAEIVELIRIAELPEAVEALRGYPNDPTGLRKWVAAAAAGWPQELVRDFLERCVTTTDHGLRLAAEQSLKGKYVKWRPY